MKQKIYLDFTRSDCTREEISDCLEVAAKEIREGKNMGKILSGQTGCVFWRLYPVRNDEMHKELVRSESNLAFRKMSFCHENGEID
jgi:hypothetical protein